MYLCQLSRARQCICIICISTAKTRLTTITHSLPWPSCVIRLLPFFLLLGAVKLLSNGLCQSHDKQLKSEVQSPLPNTPRTRTTLILALPSLMSSFRSLSQVSAIHYPVAADTVDLKVDPMRARPATQISPRARSIRISSDGAALCRAYS